MGSSHNPHENQPGVDEQTPPDGTPADQAQRSQGDSPNPSSHPPKDWKDQRPKVPSPSIFDDDESQYQNAEPSSEFGPHVPIPPSVRETFMPNVEETQDGVPGNDASLGKLISPAKESTPSDGLRPSSMNESVLDEPQQPTANESEILKRLDALVAQGTFGNANDPAKNVVGAAIRETVSDDSSITRFTSRELSSRVRRSREISRHRPQIRKTSPKPATSPKRRSRWAVVITLLVFITPLVVTIVVAGRWDNENPQWRQLKNDLGLNRQPQPTAETPDPVEINERTPKPVQEPPQPTIAQHIEKLAYPGEREEAMQQLVAAGEEAVPGLIEALSADSTEARRRAAQTLGKIGPPAKSAIPTLSLLLQSPITELNVAAIDAIARMESPDSVSPLMQGLESADVKVRLRAAQALTQLGEHSTKAVPLLLPLMTDRERAVRQAALEAIGACGAKAVPDLKQALSDKSIIIRIAAARGLGALGPASSPATEELLKACELSDKQLHRAAGFALTQIGKDAVPQLILALAHEETSVQYLAMDVLEAIEPKAIDPLIVALQHENVLIRRGAAEVLGRYGPDADSAVDALEAATNDENSDVRQYARIALQHILR